MLPRRHIRIKIFQSLYSHTQKATNNISDLNKEFERNLQGYLDLHELMIELLLLLKEVFGK